MKCLITGATGFVGSFLAEHLLECGDEVIGISRQVRWTAGAEHLGRQMSLLAADLVDSAAIRSILLEHVPDQIYHLAAQANVPDSVRDPGGTWSANFAGSRNLFNAVLEIAPRCRVLVVSTGQVYGQPPAAELPITEATLLRPTNPYTISKAAVDLLALRWTAERGANLVIARPFNHIGPRQGDSFAVAHFARQIAEIEWRGSGELQVGERNVERDFTDVRDVVRAYRQLTEAAGAGDVFNIASGVSRRVGDLLDQLLALSAADIRVVEASNLLRKGDPETMPVSPGRIEAATGWKPRIPMAQTLRETLDYWRWRVRRDG